MIDPSIDSSMRLAMDNLRSDRRDDARSVLRNLLDRVPNCSEALHLLGVMALEENDPDAASDLIGRAISANPGVPEYHSNLGNILWQKGQYDKAIASCRKALELRPGFAEASNNLANVLREVGRLDEALAAYRRAIQFKPRYAEAYRNFGNLLRDMGAPAEEVIDALQQSARLNPNLAEIHDNLGSMLKDNNRLDEAIAVFRDGVRHKPNRAETWNNLGDALNKKEAFDEAVAACKEALRLRPDYHGAWNNLGNALRGRRQFEGAVGAYRRAIGLKPEYPEAYINLGIAQHGLGRFSEGAESIRQAIRMEPECPEAHYNLGNVLHQDGRDFEAIAAWREAIRLRPGYGIAYGNMAAALMDLGDVDGAIEASETSVRLRPDLAYLFSNIVYFGLMHPDSDAARNLKTAMRWAEAFERPLAAEIRPHLNDRSVNRRLRVGYVSPDFRLQSVGRFLTQLIPNHDSEKVELFCYSDVPFGDDLTARFKKWSHHWCESVDLSDSELAERIRRDAIDVLIDLSLHTRGNRLCVFARKPAPVQATWLGYPGTTGLSNMDYRLTDRFLDPPGEGDEFYTEKSIRLPHCFWCFGSVGLASSVRPPPALSGGHVTFGCMNNFTKVNGPVLDLWATLLREVPDSRLRLHMTPDRQASILERFAKSNVNADRIEFVGKQSFEKYFEEYHRIDIALDPFPYAGGTTTCDALWMGVPTVTLRGKTTVGRGGVSILSNVGLTDWIAQDSKQYVSIAREMAGDLPRLAELRNGLRARMERSPLMDARQFTADMESAYRQMWQNWCTAAS